MTPPV
ncbi:hypothetical protein CGLO_09480 [Colletotrichum gloeosporioides Cg-14]